MLFLIFFILILILLSPSSAFSAIPSHSELFAGVSRLYWRSSPPEATLSNLEQASVLVIGIGGVGSWTAEALVRSGVGSITLCDLDDVCTSNVNRQVQALVPNVGRMKVDALSEHLLAINPDLEVNSLMDFVTASNIDSICDFSSFTVVADCIDDARDKAAIINKCHETKTTVVTVGGGAGLLDPTLVTIKDITKAGDDKVRLDEDRSDDLVQHTTMKRRHCPAYRNS